MQDNNEIDILIGKNIKTRRKELGISQQALALAIGVAFQKIQKYEKGFNRITADRLHEIAKVLKVTDGHFSKDSKLEKLPSDA